MENARVRDRFSQRRVVSPKLYLGTAARALQLKTFNKLLVFWGTSALITQLI